MQKKLTWVTFFVCGIVVLQSYKPFKTTKKDGAAPGYTGSPGDSLKNCTACHGGSVFKIPGWITSDIPSQGYDPGKTYTIKATNKEPGATRYGFEVSPQDITGKLLGTMVITDSIRTKLVGSDKYITYTALGVDGIDSLSWSFDWVAPAKGTGSVVFYGGFNSNYMGQKGGDITTLSTLTVKEINSTSLNTMISNELTFKIYPNPTDDLLTVSFEAKKNGEVLLEIIDLSGKQCAILMQQTVQGKIKTQFRTAELPDGNYFVRLHLNKNTVTQNLSIRH